MAEKKKRKAVRKYKKKAKALNYQLTRVLRERNFSPLSELLLNVYPDLTAKDKSIALFKILDYLYAKPKAVDVGPKKKGPAIQTNVQVNLPENKQQDTAPVDVRALMAAAETSDE